VIWGGGLRHTKKVLQKGREERGKMTGTSKRGQQKMGPIRKGKYDTPEDLGERTPATAQEKKKHISSEGKERRDRERTLDRRRFLIREAGARKQHEPV